MTERLGNGGDQDPHFLEPCTKDIARITSWMDKRLLDVRKGNIRRFGNYELHGHEFFIHNHTYGILEPAEGSLRELTAAEAVERLHEDTEELVRDSNLAPIGETNDVFGEVDIFAEMNEEFEQTYSLPELHITTAEGRRMGIKLYADGSIRVDSLTTVGDLNSDDHDNNIHSKRLGLNSLNHSQAIALHLLLETVYDHELALHRQSAGHEMPTHTHMVDTLLHALMDAEFSEKLMQEHLGRKATVAPSVALTKKVERSFAKLLELEGAWFTQCFDGEIPAENAALKILKRQIITGNGDNLRVAGPRCYDMKITQNFPGSGNSLADNELPEIIATTVHINEYSRSEQTYAKLIQTDLRGLNARIAATSKDICMIRQGLEQDPDSVILQTEFEKLMQLHSSLIVLYAEEHAKNKRLEQAARRESFKGAYSMSQADANEIIELCKA